MEKLQKRRIGPIPNGHDANPLAPELRENDRRLGIFLNWLNVQVAARYAEVPGRWANYEDLAYLAAQMADDLGHGHENPALQPFIRNALIDLSGLFFDLTPSAAKERLRELANDAVEHIRWTVQRSLRRSPKDTSYLKFFAQACRDAAVSEVNFFTLNHDTLLEDFLRNELRNDEVTIVDGLREPIISDGSRRWDHRVFDLTEEGKKPVRVFKLHGTINWIRWSPTRRDPEKVRSSENADRDGRFVGTYTYSPTGAPLYDHLPPARVLVGTFNKIFGYNSDMFLELHHRFLRVLEDEGCKALVVCGYGFGDKGVNTRISEWRHRSLEHRLLIIDPAEKSQVYARARGAIQMEIEAILGPQEVSEDDWMGKALQSEPSTRRGPVKHLAKGIGENPNSSVGEVVAWHEVMRRLQASEEEFVRE